MYNFETVSIVPLFEWNKYITSWICTGSVINVAGETTSTEASRREG